MSFAKWVTINGVRYSSTENRPPTPPPNRPQQQPQEPTEPPPAETTYIAVRPTVPGGPVTFRRK